MVGKATPDRGGPRKSPDGVDPKTSGWASKRTRKTQRDSHNSGVKIWSLCSVSSTLSHANLEQPFRTLAIKWEVYILLKKSSCVLYSCVCLIIESLSYGKWVYNILSQTYSSHRPTFRSSLPPCRWIFIEQLPWSFYPHFTQKLRRFTQTHLFVYFRAKITRQVDAVHRCWW